MSGIPHKDVTTVRGSFVDTSCVTPLPTSQLINQYLVSGADTRCLDSLRNDVVKPEYWNKFTIVKNTSCQKQYSKSFILKHLTDFLYPSELLPVYVNEKAHKIFFLARNCLDAIIKLCEIKLLLPNPVEPEFPFNIVIIKDVMTTNKIPVVNIEPNILKVLKKRESNGLLDLSGFYDDEDLQEFCPLFQPKVLLYVLSLTRNLEENDMKITKIVLCKNDIRVLPNLESLRERSFTSIDLGHNKIQNIEDVVPLKDLPHLAWVRLEGNPLCCRFDSGITYFLYVKTICKNLQTLDTKRLCDDQWYKKHRTFLCDSKGFDFANQFVQQFYKHFDVACRPSIGSFYHENAMFSFTHRSTSFKFYPKGNEHLNIFIYRERNILLTGSQHHNYLYSGRDVIQEQFQMFPATQHNPYTFFIDLLLYTKTQAIICVTGIFKEKTVQFIPNTFIFCFTRTFTLSSKEGREWLITNDLWHIYTPTKNTVAIPGWPGVPDDCGFPLPGRSKAKHSEALTQTFENITGMAYEHSKNFLAKNNWNLELALRVFVDEHINNEISDEVFNMQIDFPTTVDDDDSDDDVIITEDDILPSIATLLLPKPPKPIPEISSANRAQPKSQPIPNGKWANGKWVPKNNVTFVKGKRK